jgi:iron-sulfur cluster repair protein YtfE (RIC family)
MADVLHHHHQVEDDALWPVLRRHAQEAGNVEDVTTLDDMESEHGVIDPALTAVRTAFEDICAHPCTDHRNALEIRVAAARESLLEHLAHEEGQALPMLQRTLSVTENDAFERAASQAYPLRIVPFVLPWVMHELPTEARERVVEMAPPGYGLIHRLLRGRFERAERRAFRYV